MNQPPSPIFEAERLWPIQFMRRIYPIPKEITIDDITLDSLDSGIQMMQTKPGAQAT